ncbi:alpha/beta hydrolase [Chitinophaga sp. LS1]|uniref:alpha/beta fold hydrolase n=1 Tax=Chitinophaga sp. LS1 TaxID=3051176 RepID=UPI002AABD563|nr:alpha/beta hydrolase [Chitinophaga sp. LS1]WPV70675.1 alpha/beta hydrolase [Chitinophaga sp. LS1]
MRGMGSSAKPQTGYDKKNMAGDLYALIKKLGVAKAYICGHDIGAMVAYSFAANYPSATEKLIIMEGSHPNPMIEKMPMLPAKGTFTSKMSGQAPYAWWFAFNQTKGLPEKMT